jgi:AraC-like DNA-binding protein
MSETYLAPAVNIYWQLFELYGLNPKQAFQELDLEPSVMDDPSGRYPYVAIDKLWKRLADESADPCLGIKAARFWHPSYMGALGYAWLSSSSLKTALKRYDRYSRILTEGAIITVEEDKDCLSLILEYKDISLKQPTRSDSFFSYITEMCRANYGPEFAPTLLNLAHPAPESEECIQEFHDYFRCPVVFEAPKYRMCITHDIAYQKLRSSNPKMAQLNDHFMIDYLANLDDKDIVSRVKAQIIKQLASGNITDASVASELYMSVRTLQRHLKALDTTFKTLLNEVRADLAIKYLSDSSFSIGEITFMLGYREPSSFNRAFKRWTGDSPTAFRERLTA